jgi:predicted ATPase/class 3 adenylate cyclase
VRELPTGTVTLLFTDIEGSTKLLERVGEAAYEELRAGHHSAIREAIEAHDGFEINTAGDSFFVAFTTAPAALEAAADAQRTLAAGPVRVRMGVHTGTPLPTEDGYAGTDVHTAARIAAAASGDQILVSAATAALAVEALPRGLTLRDLGTHQLRDLSRPQQLFQLVGEGLPDEFPPPRTLGAHATNLPSQPTPFIGREREVAEIVELLREHRLVTLTGPGGVGKTRLALQAGADSLDAFMDGVFFVALELVTNPALLGTAIAQALGVRERDGGSIDDALADYVGERDLLVVADNFEHIVEAAPFVGRLLAESSALHFLVTSRARLRVAAEHEYAVSPLGTEAVALFVDRARAVRHDFELENGYGEAVREICARVDGLPLAIELAAARTRHLTPPALLQRLEQRLPTLTGGARDLPERQQTLRAAIDWSYRLLTEPEQQFLARVSVFNGGFTLDAAEAVCGGDAFETATTLVDHSLLRAGDDDTGEARFALLDTIREFAAEQLEASGEADAIRLRHATYFCGDPAQVLDIAHWGEARTIWGAEIELDAANVRAALDWAHANRSELELPLALKYQLFPTVYPGECRGCLRAALASDTGSPPHRARAYVALSPLALMQGDPEEAGSAAREAVRLLREAGDRPIWEARAVHYAALAAFESGDLTQALQYADELDDFADRNDDERARSLALRLRANVALSQNDYDQAVAFARERLAVLVDSDSDLWLASAHLYLSQLAVLGGDVATGVAELQAAAPIVDRVNWHNSTCDFIEAVAAVLHLAGDTATAVNLFSAVEHWLDERGEVTRVGTMSFLRERTPARDVLIMASRQPELSAAREAALTLSLDDALALARESLRQLGATATTG